MKESTQEPNFPFSLGPNSPTPPIPFANDNQTVEQESSSTTQEDHVQRLQESPRTRLAYPHISIPPEVLDTLTLLCPTFSGNSFEGAESSRDWWPRAMLWSQENQVAAHAELVVQPQTVSDVQAICKLANDHSIPLTTAGGRSGVLGGSIPIYGGILLDMKALSGIYSVNTTNNVIHVGAATFGDHLEHELQTKHFRTLGHWPQSIALSTVGGWIACRSAGQFSNKYGSIEDMVVGLEVVCADGTLIKTGGHARQATGPNLNELYLGSKGTLGVITSAWLRCHPMPETTKKSVYVFPTFSAAIHASKDIAQQGLHPAVTRVYDEIEAERTYRIKQPLFLYYDESSPVLADAVAECVSSICFKYDAKKIDNAAIDHWIHHRNDTSALQKYIVMGAVVDTMEITIAWDAAEQVYGQVCEAINTIEGVLSISAHQSHAYADGACLYFTFGGFAPDGDKDSFHQLIWDTATHIILENGGSLSHHHGIGLQRAPYMQEALGTGFRVLQSVKNALDPKGILNPGKLGFPSQFNGK